MMKLHKKLSYGSTNSSRPDPFGFRVKAFSPSTANYIPSTSNPDGKKEGGSSWEDWADLLFVGGSSFSQKNGLYSSRQTSIQASHDQTVVS